MTEFPITPLPRWSILPGDPPALQRWLRAKATEEAGPPAEEQRAQEAS